MCRQTWSATACLVALLSFVLTLATVKGAPDVDDESCPVDAADCKLTSASIFSDREDPHYEDGIARDILKLCPLASSPMRHLLQKLLRSLRSSTSLASFLNMWPKEVSPEGWADHYTVANYIIVARFFLFLYTSRDKTYVNIPTTRSDPVDVVRVENVYASHFDVDGSPNFFYFEGILPEFIMKPLYVPMLTCFYSALRRMNTDNNELNGIFSDDLNDPFLNTWEVALNNTNIKSKFEWANKFFESATTWDGTNLWPVQMTNFQTYFKQDLWDDELEHAMAFHLIGVHRVESGSWVFDRLKGIEVLNLPYRIPLNMLGSLDVREHFGRYGADMYFDADGLPTLIQTPTGENITRGGKNWQYWKFVWRSTLVTAITLIDHLHTAHFRVGNMLSRSIRTALPPEDPLRRFMSIFSFGSTFVNMQAMHTLIGPNHLLNRATPFKDFTKLANIVPATEGLMRDVPDTPSVKALLYDDVFDQLDPKIKEAPFYADGKLVMGIIQKMIRKTLEKLWSSQCMENGMWHPDILALRKEIMNETIASHWSVNQTEYQVLQDVGGTCNASDSPYRNLMFTRLSAYIFVVTAWHRHVGFVGDYYMDPTLATMSWKDGEAFGRPRQHMIMTIINVFTSTKQPLLKEDYSHLFKGMVPDLEEDMTEIWREFQRDLEELEKEIDRRNSKRKVLNINFSPRVLESSVSK